MIDFNRDRWGRPLIVPAGGGKPVAYSRVSSYGQTLENQFGLNKWKQRMVLLGAINRPDLMSLATAAKNEDRTLDGLVQQMMDAGGASRAANTGTAIHDVLAQVDAATLDVGSVADEFLAPVQAWQGLLDGLRWSAVPDMIEVTVVNDRFEAAGSLDNICCRLDGSMVVVDKKTGKSIGKRPLAYMVQLAIYATSEIYDIATGERRPLGVDTRTAYIAHIPADGGEPAMYEVDVEEGLRLADLAFQVRQAERSGEPLVRLTPTDMPLPVSDATEAKGEATESKPDAQRDWLKSRVATILTYDTGRDLLGGYWPADIPKLSADHIYSDLEVAEIVACLNWIETVLEAPFAGEDPTREPPTLPSKAPLPLVRDKPKEGRRVKDTDVAALQSKIESLPEEQQQIIMQFAKEAHDAGAPISLRQRPSVRRFEIARMLIQLVTDWPDADIALGVLRHLTGLESQTAGEIIGWLTIEQATTIVEAMPELARTGEIIIRPDGQMSINTKEN